MIDKTTFVLTHSAFEAEPRVVLKGTFVNDACPDFANRSVDEAIDRWILEVLFRVTQNMTELGWVADLRDGPWTVAKDIIGGARSTSVGDEVTLDGERTYRCLALGWRRV